MKYSNIVPLFVLLFVVLAASYIGVNLQEGLDLNRFTILNDILKTTNDLNASDNLKVISKMNIEDPSVQNILNGPQSDIQKIVLLQSLVKNGLNQNVRKDTLSQTWTQSINLVMSAN
jgi:hypothetical protein